MSSKATLTVYLRERAFNTFAIRTDTDQQLLKELSDQGFLCLVMKIWLQYDPSIVDMTSNLFTTNVQTWKFIIAPTLEKLKEHIALGLSVLPSIQNLR